MIVSALVKTKKGEREKKAERRQVDQERHLIRCREVQKSRGVLWISGWGRRHFPKTEETGGTRALRWGYT